MVLPTVTDEEAVKEFPEGVNVVDMPSGKKYLRTVTLSSDNN
jgi:hypothetical protein